MNKDKKISLVLNANGAFWAFSDKQFNEQKKDGVKYVSMGSGLICPKENAGKLNNELNAVIKEIKREEKEKLEARTKALKIEKLPKAERIQNRKILIAEAMSRINNFADDCWIAEHYKILENSTDKNIIEVIDSLLSAINSRYHDRADYEPEIKECYDENIEIIKGLKEEISKLILN